ncbi:limbic system-associated membrane protein-like [Atheta coriaria]|uniref:limbic system-associated membrane protein-like n=1 Tax=Dalotia coriaria TaxID=877792 RepID=UPI0031F46EC1
MDGKRALVIQIATIVILFQLQHTTTWAKQLENPSFHEPIENVTVTAGREAILKCVVDDLGLYKVAWLRVDTQTILTIHSHIITKNVRIGVTHSERRTWFLHIKDLRESDRGWYMCQINTDPMKSQVGYLDVVVPPDIVDYQTSPDMVVTEGSNVSMVCVARGSPTPTILWKREFGETIKQDRRDREGEASVEGTVLSIHHVNRKHMGPYLCIATNGVPPSVSKRIMLVVNFPPVIWIQYQLIGAYDGQQIVLECNSEAFPKSINYWTRDTGEIVPQNEKYDPYLVHNSYKVHMKLTIRRLETADYGIYKCVSKNAMGDTDGTINVYRIPKPAVSNKTTTQKRKIAGSKTSISTDLSYSSRSKSDQPDSLFLEEKKSSSQELFQCAHVYFLNLLALVLNLLKPQQ